MKSAVSTRSDLHSAVSLEHIMDELRRKGSSKAVAGMSRFGIRTGTALGVSIPQLRDIAKDVGTSHDLAKGLWKSEFTKHAFSPA